MFTVEQRDALSEHVLGLAERDGRVVAAAVVGSLAVDEGDRFSDVDVTLSISDGVPVADVLEDWTRTLAGDLDAVPLADLDRDPTTYRVFLLPDALQLDLSMTAAASFRPAGPRFRLVFGDIAPSEQGAPPPRPGDLFIGTPQIPDAVFGWGVIYALHASRCIMRERVWQAEHSIGTVRDHALSLACLRNGLTASNARGYEQLPDETLARFAATHVGSLEPGDLTAALSSCVSALLHEGAEADIPNHRVIAERLGVLFS